MLCAALILTHMSIASQLSYATQLTFDHAHVFPNSLDYSYGDNVATSPDGNGHSYLIGAEGPTPNVVTDYATSSVVVSVWSSNYGDLTNVAYGADITTITFTADTGFLVNLHSFEMAGWPLTDYTINAVEVLDSNGTPLFSQSNVHIEGDAAHSDFDFVTPLTDTELTIRWDAANVNATNIGIDNILISQVPEPSGVVLVACLLSIVGVGGRRETQNTL